MHSDKHEEFSLMTGKMGCFFGIWGFFRSEKTLMAASIAGAMPTICKKCVKDG